MRVHTLPLDEIRERFRVALSETQPEAAEQLALGLTTETWLTHFVDKELEDIGVVNALELSIFDFAGGSPQIQFALMPVTFQLLRAMVRDEDGAAVVAVYEEILKSVE